MQTRNERTVGIALTAARIAAMVFAMLAGLTKEAGGVDWIGVVTVAAGLVVAGTGLYETFRRRGAPTPHGPTLH
jgi:hypothetical protein